MKVNITFASALVLFAQQVAANDAIPGIHFANFLGTLAAQEAAPMWHMPSGTCMPSAAENNNGQQTNGVVADNCNIGSLAAGCPPQPPSKGINTFYGGIPGEPFPIIPTYYRVQKCNGDSSGSNQSWRIVYYVYFKKDTGHMSDWEGIVMRFTEVGKTDTWVRDSVIMEQDGNHKHMGWGDINDTFDGKDDQFNFRQKNRNHGKFYFGKFHHSVHHDWYTTAFKNTCPPNSATDYRNAEYQWWSVDNLRHTSFLNSNWNWGAASAPLFDLCAY